MGRDGFPPPLTTPITHVLRLTATLSVEAGTAGTDPARAVFDGAGGVYIEGPARPSRVRVSGNRSVDAMPYRYTYGRSRKALRPIVHPDACA